MATRKSVTLYLAGWQKRMIMDYMEFKTKKRFSKIVVAKIPDKTWVMYRQPMEIISKYNWNLYLTDEQINIVRERLGVKAKISALNISEKLIESGRIAFR